MTRTKEEICTTCKYIGHPKQITKGSFVIELALWLCFLLPGLLYSIWRISSRYAACPQCHSTTMIPLDTPRAQELVANRN